ncbi:arsenite methyltransferase [Desulforegula conservatrix]|uniref:arsenite methyltransferase n=1 Tax=Desulforegula conservatrix TaxID=153026 RepID=UPI00040E9FF1|nr:arsenite methyltransferase [Desulforegula conservatrix]
MDRKNVDRLDGDAIRQAVKDQYGEVVSGCGCGGGCCITPTPDMSGRMGYSDAEMKSVPEGANLGLGCGNPHAFASLTAGETVLDLGSGAGFDCFIAAEKVGRNGHVIGVDMTPEMISKARANALKGGFGNVDFRFGEIEKLPVDNNSVDVVISNCVINLSPDKQEVFNETFRVLKPGGRIAISDIVAIAEFPETTKHNIALYTGCIAGASPIPEIKKMLQNSGFKEIKIIPKDESRKFIREWAPGNNINDYVLSAIINAIKPLRQ